MVIINSRQDQARRIGYIYAIGLLVLGIVLKVAHTDTRTTYTWFFLGVLIAVYSVITIPRKADGARIFYDSSKADLSKRMEILAIGPAILKRNSHDSCMGALILTKEHLEFHLLWEKGICDEPMYVIDLMSFQQIEKGKRDTIIFPAEAVNEDLSEAQPSGTDALAFMVNKPELWKKEIYRARV